MPLRNGSLLPELSGATEWINGMPERDALLGNPLLIHFWSVSCGICHENMPQIAAWRDEYTPQGLQVVAIHMPRQQSDTDVERVRQDIIAMGITEPCGIDNRHAVAQAFQNEYVPAYFIFTPQGTLCGRAAGYNGLKMIEQPLKRLIESSACELPGNEG
jgi:thiol-disulfide isomerase/thioredoxin